MKNKIGKVIGNLLLISLFVGQYVITPNTIFGNNQDEFIQEDYEGITVPFEEVRQVIINTVVNVYTEIDENNVNITVQ